MSATDLSIDITRLEKVRRTGTKLTARCPACAAAGSDRRGEHFFLNTTEGKFGCGAFPGDTAHRREIFALVGIRGERQRDPQRDRQWREERKRERDASEARKRVTDAARAKRDAIVARHPWDPYDVWENSPQRIDQPLVEFDPRHFIQSLLPQNALVWTGDVRQSGKRHANHWRSVYDWQNTPESEVGPMVSPAIWKPGTVYRLRENVAAYPYVVLDFDGFDGIKPGTPAEIEKHVAASLSLVRWLREGLHWQLAALVHTGNKSIHAWFHTPSSDVLNSLRNVAEQLGIDAGLIGRGEHPCRLPGQTHLISGGRSRVLWLQSPIS